MYDSARPAKNAAMMRDVLEFRGLISGLEKPTTHNECGNNGQFKKRRAKYNALTWDFLARAWGVSPRTIHRMRESTGEEVPKTKLSVHESVIESYAAAKVKFLKL